MIQKIFDDLAIVIGLVLQAFRSRAIAKIVVAREAGVAGEEFGRKPRGIIGGNVVVGALEPDAVVVAILFFGMVDGQNHRAQKGLLRAAEIVRAVGVENAAVVLDFEEEIFDHAARQVDAMVSKKTDGDEIAVPAVHFVETAAGTDVAIRKVEKTMSFEMVGVDLTEPVNDDREMPNLDAAFLFESVQLVGDGKICGHIQNGLSGDFGVADGSTVAHGTSEDIPAMVDVVEDGWLRGGGGDLRMNRRGKGGENK